MKATIRLEWDMGHRLPNHNGACSNLHGHRYVAEIQISGELVDTHGASDEGMIADFQDIKAAAKPVVALMDHSFLLCERDPLLETMLGMPGVVSVGYIPTAENIAYHLLSALHEADKRITGLRLFETPTSHVDVSLADVMF